MKDEKAIMMLFAFRYAVHRLGTQALAEIENELIAKIGCWHRCRCRQKAILTTWKESWKKQEKFHWTMIAVFSNICWML